MLSCFLEYPACSPISIVGLLSGLKVTLYVHGWSIPESALFLTLYLPFFVAVVEDLLTLEKEKLRYRILRKKDSPEESRANGAP